MYGPFVEASENIFQSVMFLTGNCTMRNNFFNHSSISFSGCEIEKNYIIDIFYNCYFKYSLIRGNTFEDS